MLNKQVYIAIAGILLLITSCNNTAKEPDTPVLFIDSNENSSNPSNQISTTDGDDAFRGEVFGDMVYLSWQKTTGKTYEILRQNPVYQQNAASLTGQLPAGTDNYKDKNLLTGVKYYYSLNACSSSNECAIQGQRIQLQTSGPQRPRQDPVIVDVSYDAVNNSVVVRWNEVKSAYSFSLWRKEVTGNLADNDELVQTLINSLSVTDDSVSDQSRYIYRLTACSSNNRCTGYSNEYAVGIGVGLLADPLMISESISGRIISLHWSSIPLADHYFIERSYNGLSYVRVQSSSYFQFSDSISSLIGGTLQYRVQACSEKWGCSQWLESQKYTIAAASGSTSLAGENGGQQPVTITSDNHILVANVPGLQLQQPKILLTQNIAHLFWQHSARDHSSDHYLIKAGDTTHALSADRPYVALEYARNSSLEFIACSEQLYACHQGFQLNTADYNFTGGNTSLPVVTASLPHVIGLRWQSMDDVTFVILTAGKQLHALTQPQRQPGTTQYLQLRDLTENVSYSMYLANCVVASPSSLFICNQSEPVLGIQASKYDTSLDLFTVDGSWSQEQPPLLNVRSSTAFGEEAYHLVIQRQCHGEPCQQLPGNISLKIDVADVLSNKSLVTDQILEKSASPLWKTDTATVSIDYHLSVCRHDWGSCSQPQTLQLERTPRQSRIMALNPRQLGISDDVWMSVSHSLVVDNSPVSVQISRHYSDLLTNSREKNFQSSVSQKFPATRLHSSSQIFRLNKVQPFPSTLPWQHYRKQLNVSVDFSDHTINDRTDLLIQDDLRDIRADGVEEIIGVSRKSVCARFDTGKVSCLGDTDTLSAYLGSKNHQIHLTALADTVSAPIAHMQQIASTAACQANSKVLQPVTHIQSSIVDMAQSVCLLGAEGQPYCLRTEAGGFGGERYMCAMESATPLHGLYAGSNAGHACSLDNQGQVYCWGDVLLAIPKATQARYPQPTLVPFFASGNEPLVVDDVITGKAFTCLTSGGKEYCYSELHGWVDGGAPAQISLSNTHGTVIDKAILQSIVCWLQSGEGASYVHCIKAPGKETALDVPSSSLLENGQIEAFLLARFGDTLSRHAQLYLTDSAVCVFDRPALWCSGDISFHDDLYKERPPLELRDVRTFLPYSSLHDFAASPEGQFCVSHGLKKTLACWQVISHAQQHQTTALPQDFWPVIESRQIQHMALAPEYSCTATGQSVGCWGKSKNKVINAKNTQTLVSPVPNFTDVGRKIHGLVVGASTACYQGNDNWWCWGETDQLNNWHGDFQDESTSPLPEKAIPLVMPNGDSIQQLSLAKMYHGVCAISAEDGSIACSGSPLPTPLNDPKIHSDTQTSYISNQQQGRLFNAKSVVFAGVSGNCALALAYDTEDEYAVYCWGDRAFVGFDKAEEHDDIAPSQATPVLTGLPESTVLLAASSHNNLSTLALAYNPENGKIFVWGKVADKYIPLTTVHWNMAINSVALWPSSEPLVLGLTESGDIVYHSLLGGSASFLTSMAGVSAMSVGANNLCFIQGAGLLCSGDNSFGKSGLIE